MAEYLTYRSPPPEPSTSYTGHFNNGLDSIRRSFTRNSYATTTNSTRSWVRDTQQHPPPPPPEDMILEVERSPAPRASRPLPDPHQVRTSALHTVNPDPEEDEEFMEIEADVSGAQYGYPGTFFPRRMVASPPPVHTFVTEDPKPNKSFVGGFVRRLRKLPKKLVSYGAPSEKRRMFRQGTFGTEDGTTTATLPRYESNPPTPINRVGGPSTIPYGHMQPPAPPPVGVNGIPPSMLSGAMLRRPTPSLRITPPSVEDVSQESEHQIFQSVQPRSPQVVHPDHPIYANAERTTVMMYTDTNPDTSVIDVPLQRVPSRAPNTARSSRVSTVRAPSITIAAPPPPPPPVAPVLVRPNTAYETQLQSPATENPQPTADYLKMNQYGSPTARSRATFFSRTTGTSFYDPSFTHDLSPVERFFKTFYHLPWIARGRVTVDYRPDDDDRKKRKGMVKKPMASWYRRLSRSSKELDLLSNGTPSATPRTSTNLTSLGSRRSNRNRRSRSSSDLRHGHHHHHRHHKRHRNRYRNTMSTMTEEEDRRSPSPILPTVYPYPYPAYPYTYPGYAAIPPNFSVPPGQGTVLAPIPGSPNPMALASNNSPPGMVNVSPQGEFGQLHHHHSSKRGPRGPRNRRSPKKAPVYPQGYSPYQPMAFPPPPQIVVMQGSPTLSNSTPSGMTPDGSPQGLHPSQQPYYAPMVIPGGFDVGRAAASPNTTPTPRAPTAVSA